MTLISDLKKQISTIKNISKITKAMQLVATAKLKKAGARITDSKPYFAEIYTIFHDIINASNESRYQVDKIDNKQKVAWIIVNSNLGLCGGYNNNLNKMVLPQIKKNDYVVVIGTKGRSFYGNRKVNINHFIGNVGIDFSYEDAQVISAEVLSLFNQGQVQIIKLAYTKFVNNVTMEPAILNLLPITKDQVNAGSKNHQVMTEFEPSAKAVLETAIPFYMNSLIYSSIIESQVSEQASRRNAMENATNNADEMLNKLSLLYNRRRQSAITQEIIEIISGANAQKGI